jgi:tRNA-splicing ligase RtcB (3'-phosphate/5'-hydroxy nucleic acid ligase)
MAPLRESHRRMRWAQQYALLNREEMMDRVVACFADWVGAPDAQSVERQNSSVPCAR